ncbi:MAG TPA: AmmeMemoRadiSam system protein A [Pyrinomonadaceae bacterium]|nr:AmmeMemoRadiSam system protein A [Pyrinomonadaceae bacterium]
MNAKTEKTEQGEEPDVAANASTSAASSDEERLPELARRAVETYVSAQRVLDAADVSDSSLLGQRAACFVSIKTVEGDLRGCIGTVEPAKATLAEELVANAISAATRDPRFMPVEISELPRLRYSVDVLSPPEPTSFKELNPKTYGVIVEDAQGWRRGLLLPDIEGVETAEQQFQIAARKAGIRPDADVRLYRFEVRRFGE